MKTLIGGERKPRLFEGEQALVWTGLLGFLLAAMCAVWTIIFGGAVSPDGDVAKAISFDAALGAFLLSTAAIAPLSGLGARGRSIFRWSYIVLTIYAYGVETIQQFRGVNPRFVESGNPADVWIGVSFGIVAVLLVVFYAVIGIRYFTSRTMDRRPVLVLGIRYAMIAVLLAFAAGFWISFNQGRYTGEHGNIIWLHGIGFHALQAIPFVGWLAERTKLGHRQPGRYVHAAGLAYLAGLAAVGWQTLLGASLLEWSALPITAAACFLVCFGAVMASLRQALAAASGGQSASRPERSA